MIITKYLGPTNTKGSRIKATYDDMSVTIPMDYGMSLEERHAKAADALRRKFDIDAKLRLVGSWAGGYYFGFSATFGKEF